MAQTTAVYYRDKRGVEPVNQFIEGLPAKRAAKIDDYVEEHLSGKSPDAPPAEHPITSQIEGELRELRVRFANTRYHILYQRSGNLIVLCTRSRRTPGRCRPPIRQWRSDVWPISSEGWMQSRGCPRGRRVKMRLPTAEGGVDSLSI